MSLSEICSCDWDTDYNGFQCSEIRTARKRHKCCECHGFVEPGEKYERVAGSYDRAIWESRTCTRCLDIRRWIRNQIPCFCWLYGDMLEQVGRTVEAAYEVAPAEVKGLRMGIGRRIVALNRHNAKHRLSPRPADRRQEGAMQ